MPFSKILVADDFEPFRRLVCSALEQRAEFRVIGEAADGLETIRKAEELQPDLIILDIGLPKRNGIAAAREIRKVAPNSKVLFLSQHTLPEIVEEAFRTGASGYVVKEDAGIELLVALESVIQGRRFVSRRLEGSISLEVQDTQSPGSRFGTEGSAPAPAAETKITHVHQVKFYSDEAGFLDSFADFIADVLEAGNTVIVVVTEPHRDALFSKLQARGLDVASAVEQGNYIALEVAETLSTFMVDDLPDPILFSMAVDELMRTARAGKGENRRVAACGECAPVLCAQGKGEAAVRLEQLWDEIARTHDVDVLCGYPMTGFRGKDGRDMFQRICAEHTAVYSP